jgi:hypothetical protein
VPPPAAAAPQPPIPVAADVRPFQSQ